MPWRFKHVQVHRQAHERVDDARDAALAAEVEKPGAGDAAGAGGKIDHRGAPRPARYARVIAGSNCEPAAAVRRRGGVERVERVGGQGQGEDGGERFERAVFVPGGGGGEVGSVGGVAGDRRGDRSRAVGERGSAVAREARERVEVVVRDVGGGAAEGEQPSQAGGAGRVQRQAGGEGPGERGEAFAAALRARVPGVDAGDEGSEGGVLVRRGERRARRGVPAGRHRGEELAERADQLDAEFSAGFREDREKGFAGIAGLGGVFDRFEEGMRDAECRGVRGDAVPAQAVGDARAVVVLPVPADQVGRLRRDLGELGGDAGAEEGHVGVGEEAFCGRGVRRRGRRRPSRSRLRRRRPSSPRRRPLGRCGGRRSAPRARHGGGRSRCGGRRMRRRPRYTMRERRPPQNQSTGTAILAGRRSPHRAETLTHQRRPNPRRLRRRNRQHAAHRAAQAFRRDRAVRLRQGRVPESGRLGEGSGGARDRARLRGARAARARRNRRRRDGREHRDRADAGRERARVPHRHRDARRSGAGEIRIVARVRRGSARRRGRAVYESGELLSRRAADGGSDP